MGRSIFIIDDYPINLQIAKIFIRKQGFFEKIDTFLRADEALDHILTHVDKTVHLPDVILLDIHMPIMDGWKFLDRFEDILPDLSKHIDVFILSTSLDYYDKQRIKRYPSVKGVFSKPLETEMLEDIAAIRLASVS